ncbi:hypothetical protein A2U01_0027570, partial [Trifolium medium]|nr:hypothetical protein [Trifolium medium]
DFISGGGRKIPLYRYKKSLALYLLLAALQLSNTEIILYLGLVHGYDALPGLSI